MLTDDEHRTWTDYVMAQARRTVEEYGPRPPGSDGEKRLQDWVAEELSACCDGTAQVEPFTVAPKAFMGQQRVTAVLMGMALLAFLYHPLAAALLSFAAFAVVYFELLRYRQFIDPFFRQATSYNVYARRNAAGPAKRRIVFNAHPDAAFEWRLHYRFPGKLPLFVLVSLLSLTGALLYHLVLTVVTFAAPDWFDAWAATFAWVQIVFIPGVLIGLLWVNFGVVAPGANDNLTGVFLVTGLARALHEKDLHLPNTEIGFLITGSEEAGLRGAKAFAAAHAHEFSDAETVFIALDTFRDAPHLAVYNRDLNGTVAHDPAVCKLLKDAGAHAGLDLRYATVTVGSTDGTAFTQAGLRTGALCAMDPAPAPFYHTRLDSPDNMDGTCIANAQAVLCAAIEQFDAQGLPEPANT